MVARCTATGSRAGADARVGDDLRGRGVGAVDVEKLGPEIQPRRVIEQGPDGRVRRAFDVSAGRGIEVERPFLRQMLDDGRRDRFGHRTPQERRVGVDRVPVTVVPEDLGAGDVAIVDVGYGATGDAELLRLVCER